MRSRVPLPALAGLGIAAGLIAVSYGHIYDVARDSGADPWEAAIIAATVDGLIVMALSTIALAGRHGVKPPKIAKAALVVGVVATGAANLVHGVSYGWTGVAVAIWVPLVAEVAYLLAMAALRIVRQAKDTRPVICGHRVPVSAVMVRVAADRAAAVAAAEQEAAVMTARPVICGRVMSVAALSATLPVSAPDARPVICGADIPVTALADTLPVRPVLPVICGHVVPVSAVTAPLADDRPVICGGRLVSAAEVLARPPVSAPTERPAIPAARPAKSGRPTGHRPVTAAVAEARETAVMEWLTDPSAPDTRMTAATGAEVAALLAERNLGTVSVRTGRRILAAVRESLGELAAV
ncbi:DUF2637 domain-containing protein [Nocardiopsis sp. NPDC006139]|uniref:DUF2637 domain-containing protein n=1 Tax=Nocardiopsis sp. NPDC006139 TaxID=3154578 RepID=UPI0033ACA835